MRADPQGWLFPLLVLGLFISVSAAGSAMIVAAFEIALFNVYERVAAQLAQSTEVVFIPEEHFNRPNTTNSGSGNEYN